MIKIYALNIKNTINKLEIEKISNKLDNYGLNTKRNFKFDEDLYRTTWGEIMIRAIMSKLLRLQNNQLNFNRNSFGKPYLSNISKYKFNVSHSGEWVVVAISNFEVGIDIEKKIALHTDIVDNFFTKTERNYVYNGNKETIINRFYEIWTLKESYIKAIGKGFSLSLESFSVCKKDYVNNIRDINIRGDDSKTYFFRSYNFENEYIISISSVSSNFSNEIKKIDSRLLYERFINI